MEDGKRYRHELKFYINKPDCLELRSRLKYLARPDPNATEDGGYMVRSLYFDNYADIAVTEKLMGVSRREKFRLRYYNGDTSFLRLEKKSKVNKMCLKSSEAVSADECEAMLKGHAGFSPASDRPLTLELYAKMKGQCLAPRAIVDYHREAYIYGPGNVRITMDSNVRVSNNVGAFLNPDRLTVPSAAAIVLEVKYDGFLPDVIRDAVQLKNRHETEFSKYVVSRMV